MEIEFLRMVDTENVNIEYIVLNLDDLVNDSSSWVAKRCEEQCPEHNTL